MSYENLYASQRGAVLAAITNVDDRTTLAELRHIAHDTASAVIAETADAVRQLEVVNLESVLLLLGQRP